MRFMVFRNFLCGVLSLVSAAEAQIASQYRVLLSAPQTQTFEVECRFSGIESSEFELKLPVWRPGKYQVLDPAGTISWLRAETVDGEGLSVRKTDKSTWLIASGGAENVVVRYEVYANSLADRTRHVDDTHAFLSGSSVFLYHPPRRSDPIEVHIEAPEGWAVATGLPSVPGRDSVYLAESYDVLVDSPLEIGLQERLTFEVEDRIHEIVIWGEADFDREKLVDDFRAIVTNQIELWGGVPYERYVFLIHIGTGFRGGTEHLNSTIMQTSREQLEDEKKYRDFLGLVSHEFFHTWNIKQIRPRGLSPYEYQRENYTPLLWFVEGTTSYYDDLCLVRSGLISVDEYLNRISKLIDGFRKTPGRRIQSLSESSFDAWIKFTHPTPNSRNTTVSFYSKGALVSLLLDLHLRDVSRGTLSLDDVLRRLFRDFPLGSEGYSEEGFVSLIAALLGEDVESFFEDYIRGVEPLGLEDALKRRGLELKLSPAEKGSQKDQVGYLGLVFKGNQVGAVLSDGPAYQAGIMSGDEVLAFDRRRLEAGTSKERMEQLVPGEKVLVTLFRRDRLLDISVPIEGRQPGSWSVSKLKEPTDEQKEAFEAWLQQSWTEEKED